jgi:hypothetical protein
MNDWLQKRPAEENIEFLGQVSDLLSLLGGPLTMDLATLVRKRDYIGLVNYQFDYAAGHSYRDYVLARQVHALFQKQEWFDMGIDTRSVAEEKFWQMEDRCQATNNTLDSGRLTADARKVLHHARVKIQSTLGHVPKLSELSLSFGPGATTAVKGRIAHPRTKLAASLACSRDSLPFVGDLLSQVPSWAIHHAGLKSINPSSRVATVSPDGTVYLPDPEASMSVLVKVSEHAGKLTYVQKDARSMRSIIVEPTLNGFVQKGIGNHLKDRMLKRAGVNLKDQTRNQSLAYEGSISNRLATVDLSSASDTVAWSLVRELLPWEWFEFLASWRTGDVETPDGSVELHKFSSMGNAFTFELESLIFFSLAVGASYHLGLELDEISVFGDDLIVPVESCELLYQVLDELGFIVNNEKSFRSGPFRESCGADWLSGRSIRPFYAKKALSEQTLYTFHNFAVRNGERELADLILSWTEPSMRLWGPDGYGDGHLVGSYSLRTNRYMRRAGWEGGFFDSYSTKPNRLLKNRRYSSDWLYPSYSVYTRSGERDQTDPDIVRGSDGYAKVSLYTLARGVFL